ncbi:class I SAM-dependent methyltransferase [Xanthomonas albilineans]|uniref:class I SAM-dependent methyltransferase n=1 Tax=Xanthomonas albilineans TaxID=29447 RepID=UPI0005F33B3B|nr:class I SAM-dependent methyltransferase [Xanthomonas albilineans]
MIAFPLSPSMLMIPRSLSLSAWLGHIPFASWLVEQLRPASIVELGTHRGASFLAFCQSVQEQGLTSRVFAVDTWEGDEHAGFYSEDIYAELRDFQQRYYAGVSEMLRMRFDDALQYFSDGTIDLLHIDGLHTYEAVKQDFESWLPKLSGRAVVLFHDTCVREREFGVWRYWSEISQRYPSFEFTHTHGLGVLLVGEERNPELTRLADFTVSGHFAPINKVFDALGCNIKNLEEIERLYAALEMERGEVVRLTQKVQEQQKAQEQQQLLAMQEMLQTMSQDLGSQITREQISTDERVQSLRELIAVIAQRLEEHGQKLDRLLLPWWRS